MALFVGNQSSSEIVTEPMYILLWDACAGAHVPLPEKEDLACYFPEGHAEQLNESMGLVPRQDLPSYNLPSMLLCKVKDLLRKVEHETDEVYAKINLLPLDDQSEPIIQDVVPKPEMLVFDSFCKTLTPSDTKAHGGFFFPKRHADKCLPALDMSKEVPSQTLVATDLQKKEWHFGHVYRGQPKRHLLTSGWSSFLSSKKLVAGDVFILLSGDAKADIRVGVKRVMTQQFNRLCTFISSENIQNGLLADVARAIWTKTEFSVLFKPRTMRSNFVVSVNKYLEGKNRNWSVGMRFMMKFDGEDAHEKRFIGTVTGVHANGDSDWRSLKVQWDEPSSIFRPERVSFWEIEPLPTNYFTISQHGQGHKRPRASSDGASTSGTSLASSSFTPGFGAELPLAVEQDSTNQKKQTTSGNSFKLFGVEIAENSNANECLPPAFVPEPAVALDEHNVPSNDIQSYTKEQMIEHLFGVGGLNEDEEDAIDGLLSLKMGAMKDHQP